jgi:hypothetical protein
MLVTVLKEIVTRSVAMYQGARRIEIEIGVVQESSRKLDLLHCKILGLTIDAPLCIRGGATRSNTSSSARSKAPFLVPIFYVRDPRYIKNRYKS